MAAIVEEAHKNGIKVLSHTVTLERAKIAGRAGVDVIAHGISDRPVDRELLRILKSKGTTYAPTLAVYEPRSRNVLTPLLQTVMEPLLRMAVKPPLTEPGNGNSHAAPAARQRRWQYLLDNTRRLREAGIPFAVGTDAGVTGTYHGWATLRELSLLVMGGLTPLEAIAAATSGAARALGVLDERGAVEPGKLADLVLVEGSPHRKIEEMERIRRVFLGGRELDREALARDIASPLPTPLDAVAVPQKVDDFERADGRSALDTLWVNSTDSGHNHTRMIFGRRLRDHGNHALSVTAQMAQKDHPYARVNVPLSPGAVEPADASASHAHV
ncbi:MAG: amidohydrolase family protein [Bryobacteraceae bacterium]